MVGARLGRYTIVEKIGEGGMGEVYRAHDDRLDRHVAIKFLPAGTFSDESARRRFRNEALALARLNHANIATVHDFDHEDGADFLVMEHVAGESLDVLLQRGPLPGKELIRAAEQVAAALDEAHQQGIIHRDLKPGNIRLTPKKQVKVLDFGLAKLLQPAGADTVTATLSSAQAVEGTLPYMAPEQLRGEPLDARTDLWAMGAVLYEMATGRRPFDQKLATTLTDAILNRPPAPPRSAHPELSPELERIILKCLEKDPENRYQSARELMVDLRRLVASTELSTGVVVQPAAARPRLRRLVPAVVLLLVIAAGAGYWLLRRQNVPSRTGHIRSLVVLPLKNLSGDPAQEYFAEAMTEELTNEMASLVSLRVISRTSAGRYREPSKSVREIARELDVDAVIEGSVLRFDDQARITVQLIDGSTDQHLWSKSYTPSAADVIRLQREVAREIAREIQLTLTPQEQQRFESAATRNPQAYEAYLRATYRLQSVFRSVEDVDAAIANAEQAIALDPNFADAYVALAAGSVGKIFAWQGGNEYDEKAFVALGKALALDPNLAPAYVIRGRLYYTKLRGFDIAQAVADYRHALVLNPNLAEGHQSLGSELTHAGLHQEAIEEFRATLRLNPHFEGAKFRMARALWQSGRFAEALEQFERNNIVNAEKAVTLAYLDRQKEAWEVVDLLKLKQGTATHRGGGPDLADVAAARALLFAREGKQRDALREIDTAYQFGKDTDHFHHAAFLIAGAQAELGRKAEAVAWLKRLADSGMPNYPLFRANPSMRKLQGDPAFEQFMLQLKIRWDELAASLSRPASVDRGGRLVSLTTREGTRQSSMNQ
ncbi:MAG TPA: protein kinase [Terriglobales bacterium]|nr:protein kinase [Terriglobales bacterium]